MDENARKNRSNTEDWTILLPSGTELWASVLLLLLGIGLVTTNGVLLWLIKRKKGTKAKTFHIKMAASQATSDLLLGLFITPMEVVHHVLPQAGINEYICLIHQVTILFFPLVSTSHLIFVSLERFLKVVHSLQASTIALKSKVKHIVYFCWVFPFLLAILPFLGWNRLHTGSHYTSSLQSKYRYVSSAQCSRLEHLKCSYIILLVTFILSMYVVMAVMYFQVVVVARRKIEQTAMVSDCDMRQEVRILYILLWSACFFVVSWCPLFSVISVECVYAPTPDFMWVLTFVFAYSNNFISPIVYGYGDRAIREFVSNKIRGKRSHVTPVPQQQSEALSVRTEKTKVHITTCVVIYE